MKRYIIKDTGEEIKIGNVISITKTTKVSFGTIKSKQEMVVDKNVLKYLIDKGVVQVETSTEVIEDISFYLGILAKQLGKSVDEVAEILEAMNKVCPRAVLDLLLNTIAIHFYKDDPEAFDSAERYYSTKLYDGTCGEVHKLHGHIPLFKSKEDVEKARNILKGQLEFMYGKQKGN